MLLPFYTEVGHIPVDELASAHYQCASRYFLPKYWQGCFLRSHVTFTSDSEKYSLLMEYRTSDRFALIDFLGSKNCRYTLVLSNGIMRLSRIYLRTFGAHAELFDETCTRGRQAAKGCRTWLNLCRHCRASCWSEPCSRPISC